MLDEIRKVSRDERVSSIDNKELDKKLYTTISNQQHKLIQVLGKVRTMSTALAATNAAHARLWSTITQDSENIYTITPGTSPIYPVSCVDNQKAEIVPEFGIIISNRLDTTLVFTDSLGNINPSIELMRATTTGVVDELALQALTENDINNILLMDDPYQAKFIGPDVSSASLTVDIYSKNKVMTLNAIKIINSPAIGAISTLFAKYDGINPVVVNGNENLTIYSDYNDTRAMPGYIHFQPVETQLMRFMLFSDLHISILNAVIIGVSIIVGEYNTYASKSYIGYKITPPAGATKIKNVGIYTDGYGETVDNVNIKIYDNLLDFDSMTNDYIKLVTNVMSIDMAITGDIWYLMELESVNNTTPTITKIVTEFE